MIASSVTMKRFYLLEWHTTRLWTTLQIIPIFFKKITLCINAWIQKDLSKNNRFSAKEETNHIRGTGKRKKVPVSKILESSGSLPLPHGPSFIVETRDNNMQGQLSNSSIIQAGAALSIWVDFLALYCHKEIHYRWSGGPRSASGLFFYCAKNYQKDCNLIKLTFTCSKSKKERQSKV